MQTTHPLLGVPLIERTLRSLRAAGVSRFYVVIGYRGDQIRHFLSGLGPVLSVSITIIDNPDWQGGNGRSVLVARDHLVEPFLLTMSDHVFDPSIVRSVTDQALPDGEITLAVDCEVSNPTVDLEDVTRVRTQNRRITDVGKGLGDFNGFDTGIFYCTPVLFEALEYSIAEQGDDSLSGGVRRLAAEGRANAFDIGSRFWLDIDSPAALAKTETLLLENLRGKSNDGPISRYLNRPLSVHLTRYLARLAVTPNQISLFSFLCSIAAAALITISGYAPSNLTAHLCLAIGGLIAQFASVIDGCDGEIARLKFQQSDYGAWFDAVLDR